MLIPLLGLSAAPAGEEPAHDRPYFLPATERDRIRERIRAEDGAKAEYARVKALAAQGDGYWAAFLYAFEGDEACLAAARRKLLEQFGGGWLVSTARQRLAEPVFFRAGQPGIPEVYYDLDVSGLIAYDWVWKGLTPDERRSIEDGMLAVARYKMRCMDRWTQTPNLVLKPTFMVAMTGLVTRDAECLAWGFHRKPGSGIGGYFPVLDVMLRDGGPWHEAPIYPISHQGLFVMSLMSRYGGLYDGVDWFRRKTAGGGSVRGLLDYYLASAYPIERTGRGPGQIRCATYGDGATGPNGADLFLVNPAAREGSCIAEPALAAAFTASGGDPRYAPFVAMIPDYKPTLWDPPQPPANAPLPPAPSSIWPTYGLAMLRSDESPAYWTNHNAIAVFALMTQSYGHEHNDKFGITLHGANRLFYPDCNPIQYENPDIGWTRNTVCHNTMVVDEGETRSAPSTDVRHDFAPEVKFLSVSCDRVYPGIEQTRGLFLTREYLLDVFSARSAVPHTYDYVLHSFGRPRPVAPAAFAPAAVLEKRYWLMKEQHALTTDQHWQVDFVYRDGPLARPNGCGPEWFEHDAALRLAMAPETNTLVVHGVDVHGVPMLVARRAGRRGTAFVSTHEPFVQPAVPVVQSVRVLAETPDAVLVRVDAAAFTDYAAIAWGPQKDGVTHTLAAVGGEPAAVAFTNYGYLRVNREGGIIARGGWSALSVPAANGPVLLNGQRVRAQHERGALMIGPQPIAVKPVAPPDPECPLAVEIAPAIVRLGAGTRRTVALTIRNTLPGAVAGAIEFQLPAEVTVEPRRPEFAALAPGATAQIAISFSATYDPRAGGPRSVPYRLILRRDGREQATAFRPLTVMLGPTLEFAYRHPAPNVYRISAPAYTAECDMFHGLCRRLADDDGVTRLGGAPLFTFRDGQTEMLGEGTKQAFTWPSEAPAGLTAHAYDRCRFRVACEDDRLTVSMDPDWTQFERAEFTVPGRWRAPGGAPHWERIIAVDGAGAESGALPGDMVKLAAAELAFPGSQWSLAFAFQPPQEVRFDGAGFRFALRSQAGDRWSVGFCRNGTLDAWRQLPRAGRHE